jgi:hypothetical protein
VGGKWSAHHHHGLAENAENAEIEFTIQANLENQP